MKAIVWIFGFVLISVLITGLTTDFQFDDISFQQHDTYYALKSWHLIAFLTVALTGAQWLYILIGSVANRTVLIIIGVVVIIIALFLLLNLFVHITTMQIATQHNSTSQLKSRLPFTLATATFVIYATFLSIRIFGRAFRQ